MVSDECRVEDARRNLLTLLGEHVHLWIPERLGAESSPHARGALYGNSKFNVPFRIIPACAGRTLERPRERDEQRDHPRMRGEHLRSSAPRPRDHGFIPVCAGSTRIWQQCLPHLRDYPRMRGEHVAHVGDDATAVGSSPHARGAHHHHDASHRWHRIIPACAGSTKEPKPPRHLLWDHPRMRGEHTS